ncbi:MAG: type IV conjugative transfer system protein TraL [Burkholderiales bacterium]|nr:type IV conjugative transfer system protein TraL [Burkholderiales bacterium]
MNNSPENLRINLIPRTLDARPKFLLWDLDTVLVFFAGLGIGIIANSMVLGFVSSVLFGWGWVRLKAGRHPAYGFHLLYWHTPMQPFKRTPASCKRNFIG